MDGDKFRGKADSKEMKRRGVVYFFAHWHPTAETSSQPNDFSYEGFEGEIFL